MNVHSRDAVEEGEEGAREGTTVLRGGERCDDDVVKKEGEKTKQKELRQTRAKTQPQSDLDLCSHLNTHSRVGDITDVCGRGRERKREQ